MSSSGSTSDPTVPVHWVAAQNGVIPFEAVLAGQEADKQPIYIGRSLYQGTLLIGNVGRHLNGLMAIGQYGAIYFDKYDVLCTAHPERLRWIDCVGATIPHRGSSEEQHTLNVETPHPLRRMQWGLPQGWSLVSIGRTDEYGEMYVARTWYMGMLYVGFVAEHDGSHIYFIADGEKKRALSFAVLAYA